MFTIDEDTSVERLENGDVRFVRKGEEFVIPSSIWCSVVTTVAFKQDDAEVHQKVVELHEGK